MEYLYLICVLMALGMLLWSMVFDLRKSTTQFISILIVVASNLGFYFISVSNNLEEAILAQKIAYIGGIFLPAFYFLWMMEICHVKLSRFVSSAIITVQCMLYGFVCTIGNTDLFYRSISISVKHGITVLDKEYGPIHSLHLMTMYMYLIAAFIVAIYSLAKRKSVDKGGLLTMVIISMIAVIAYGVEMCLRIDYEIMPITFVVLLMGALIPAYDSSVFTVYENVDVIEEQLNQVGFLTFSKRMIYKGCDTFAAEVFPELSEYSLGRRIKNCSSSLNNVISQISRLEEIYKQNDKNEHVHIDLEPFVINDRYYIGKIHVVSNTFGKLKGFTIELRDDTEHHRVVTLKEHYNDILAKEVDAKTKRIRSIQQKTILGMAQMVESRDLSTGGHIKRTSDVVKIFARKLRESDLGLDQRFLELVIRSAPMHDIGKIGVDDAILRKQGRFTDEEYAIMKKHSEIGYHMVSEILSDVEEPDFVSVAENVAHYHHEKVNGTGYPTGIKGEEIPIEARIMALADVFDALVSKRCYKEAFSYDKAFEIIKKDSGTHFDDKLAQIFLECRPELEAYYNEAN